MLIEFLGALTDPPNPAPQAPPGMELVAEQFIGWLKWAAVVAGVVGLTVCGMQMMMGRRHRSAAAVDGALGVPWVLLGLSLVAFAAGIVGAVVS